MRAKTLWNRPVFKLAIGAAVLLAAGNRAAGEELVTGPPEGTALTPVRCYANSGPFAGLEEVDVAAEIGDGPGAFLFIHELNRNTVPLMRGIDNLNSEYAIYGFKAFNIRLIADRTAGEEELMRVNGSLKLGNPIVLSLEGLDGPGNYALNRKCTLSLVTTKDGKVHRSVAYVDTGMADLPEMRKLIEETIGEMPTDAKALRKLAEANLPADAEALRAIAARQAVELHRFHHEKAVQFESGPRYPNQRRNTMQQRPKPGEGRGESRMTGNEKAPARGGGEKTAESGDGSDGENPVQRRGKAPEDPELNALLRSFIRKTNDDATTGEILADIKARSAVSEELRVETVEMFQLMLSYPDRYGSAHAQELAKQFLEKEGK